MTTHQTNQKIATTNHRRRFQLTGLVLLIAATALVAHARRLPEATPPTPLPVVELPIAVVDPIDAALAEHARIEAVFVLDTTGSMSGLIEGAKQKIWTIANEMANAQNTPDIRMGLIGYRDRGDQYITRRFELSRDVDGLYANLQAFAAGGGGDGPESVNQALHEAVNQMGWSDDPSVYRVIFLVGDAPPHMDYEQDVPYQTSIRQASARGIVVNAIQCGRNTQTRAIWQAIAHQSQGNYAAIEQNGGMVAVATPVDDDLARLNRELSKTVLAYGGGEEQREILDKLDRAKKAAAPSVASRLSYMTKKGGALNSGRRDLVAAIESGDVALEAVPEAELPAELKGKDREERAAVVAEKNAERKRIQSEIAQLVDERDRFLADERARRVAEGDADGFDDKVLDAVRSQAAQKGIVY